MTQNAYFSLVVHTKQLLLGKFCATAAGTSIWTHGWTHGGGGGRKDRRGSRNSYLDETAAWHVYEGKWVLFKVV